MGARRSADDRPARVEHHLRSAAVPTRRPAWLDASRPRETAHTATQGGQPPPFCLDTALATLNPRVLTRAQARWLGAWFAAGSPDPLDDPRLWARRPRFPGEPGPARKYCEAR